MKKHPTIQEIMKLASKSVKGRNLPGVERAAQNRRAHAMNKTEAEWGRALKNANPGAIIHAQPGKFFDLSATSDTYTPDFLVVHSFLPIEVWEVKGGYKGGQYEQGWERYKRAAAQYSDGIHYQFYLAEKTKSGWIRTKWGTKSGTAAEGEDVTEGEK